MRNAERQWALREQDSGGVQALIDGLGLLRPVAQALINRGIKDAQTAERFLSANLRDLHPPEGLADIRRAAERTLEAINKGETILVYGDYDVDGVSSVALLKRFLQSVGARVHHAIPHRERDGYGLNLGLLKDAAQRGVSLVITADCGVSDHEEIEQARELGMEVVVTDHHEVPDRLPSAYAVVNPKRPDNEYPFSELAGVGVAFMLVWAVARRLKESGFWAQGRLPSLKEHLDLVALGTVADQAPLVGENRSLVKHGVLRLISHSPPWLRALTKAGGMEGRSPTVGILSYQLAPRLNAPGRMDEATPALELLLNEDDQEAEQLASLLDRMNQERQRTEERHYREACILAEQEVSRGRMALVLAREEWHPGVLGIVASRLVDRYGLPAVLVALQDGVGKGSARSAEDFDLIRHLRKCEEYLDRCGGHRLAAGLRIDHRKLKSFREAFCAQARSVLAHAPRGKVLKIDARLSPTQVSEELVSQLARLEPHGVGNPEPVFQMDQLDILECRRVGTDHLKFRVRGDGVGFDAIGFGLGSMYPATLEGPVRLACTPQLNEWKGRTSIQLKIKDLKTL